MKAKKYIGRQRNGRSRKALTNPRRGGPGILVTCEAGREHQCQRDALEIVRHYYSSSDNLLTKDACGKTTSVSDKKESSAFQVPTRPLDLEEEISMLQQGVCSEVVCQGERTKHVSKEPFQIYDTGVRGVVFVMYTPADSHTTNQHHRIDKTQDDLKAVDIVNPTASLEQFTNYSSWDPFDTIRNIIHDIQCRTHHVPRSRFVTRMIPIQTTCFASLPEISHTAKLFFSQVLFPIGRQARHANHKPPTFKIDLHRRSCSNVNRDEVIRSIASMVWNYSDEDTTQEQVTQDHVPLFDVDLKNPEYTILIEICRTLCGMSVVPNVKAYDNFNLVSIANSGGCIQEDEDPITCVGSI